MSIFDEYVALNWLNFGKKVREKPLEYLCDYQ